MAQGDVVKWWIYGGDDGTTYNVKLTNQVGVAGGFLPSSKGAAPPWPYHYRDMRHVTGNAGPGKSARLPIGLITDGRFISASGSWTTYGVAKTITGAEGERRPATHLR